MPRISVITPTVRPEGLKIVEAALRKQTFTDFEWLIGAKEACPIVDTPFETRWIADDFEGGFWTLNRIYNRLFKEAKGELVVSLQDWIYIPSDGLQKFWDAYAEHPDALISGVGDQYQEWDGKRKPTVKIWADPRKTTKYGTFYECFYNDCEWNWAAIPKAIFNAVGGMDEKLDFLGFGGDQLQTCDRISDMRFYKFFLDQDNESYTVRHSRDAHGGQEAWDKDHVLFNGKYVERKNELIKLKQWPILIDNEG